MAMVPLTVTHVLLLLELPTLYVADHPESKYRYFMTEDPATWATYDVQTRAKTARPSKVIGKSMADQTPKVVLQHHPWGVSWSSPHMTRCAAPHLCVHQILAFTLIQQEGANATTTFTRCSSSLSISTVQRQNSCRTRSGSRPCRYASAKHCAIHLAICYLLRNHARFTGI